MIEVYPKVTVLMPVYNCSQYVGDAIESILGQSFTDFEFLIIDDASNDETVSIIRTFKDSRIRLIEKPKNTGYTNSLNYGLTIAKGEYIARMDGDDISLPERFAKQVAFMDTHPEVIACGTTYSIMGSRLVKKVPIHHNDIKVQLLRRTCFGHPTVMLRNTVFDKFKIRYDPSKEPAEDYDLWVRLLAYGEFYNLPEVLLLYRVHDSQVSVKKSKKKFSNYYVIKMNVLNYLDTSLTADEGKILERIIFRQVIFYKEFEVFASIKKKLLLANKKGVFDASGFYEYINEMEYLLYKDYFLNRKAYFPKLISHYVSINSSFGFKLSPLDAIKLIVKSLIFYSR
ncbi:glycosyltransferase family 2 protein [Corallibacter sp.]|uniref:glycosyltransferase family 2 protein n=1 Tax=Corallibacter sp. TaxID=2038084 RepID=UPI003AB6E7EE